MTSTWLWLSLIGLGAFHGLNPAMGWLFSVGLGLQHKSRLKVISSLVPIGIGHAVSIALVVSSAILLRDRVDIGMLQWIAGATLITFGIYRLVARHRLNGFGMQAGFGDLFLWSFLSATGHGAGLMLLPLLLNSKHPAHSAHVHALGGATATIIHSVATLVTTGIIAIVVYDWIGLAFLRRGWINLERIWAPALMLAGAWLIAVRISGF